MKLNMLATKHKATTCKEQYSMRKNIDVRIPEPVSQQRNNMRYVKPPKNISTITL